MEEKTLNELKIMAFDKIVEHEEHQIVMQKAQIAMQKAQAELVEISKEIQKKKQETNNI